MTTACDRDTRWVCRLITASLPALLLCGAVAPGAETKAPSGEAFAGIVQETVALRGTWLKGFMRLQAAGEKATVTYLTLSKAVMAKDVRLLVLRVGSRYATADAWIPGFNVVLEVDRIEPPTGMGQDEPRQETVTIVVPRSLILEERDMKMTFSITLKPGTGQNRTGTYRVRVGSVERNGAASVQIGTVAADTAFPSDYPGIKPAGKSAAELARAAIELEREACRRYQDLLWIDGATRDLPPNGVPRYPVPTRCVPQGGGSGTKAVDKGDIEGGLDDLDDLLEIDPEVVKRAEKVEKAATQAQVAASAPVTPEAMREIREHVARMRAVAERFVDPAAEPDAPLTSGLSCPDPSFGPWYGFAPLASEKGLINIVPADVGKPGRQEWRYVTHWKVLGPIPLDAPSPLCTALPHRFFLPGAVYAIFQQYLPRRKATDAKADGTTPEPDSTPQAKAIVAGMRWISWDVEPATGILRPPQWYTATGSGYGTMPSGNVNSEWFAATEINAEEDCEVWVAMGADEDALVWVNDKLLAAWPDPDRRQDMESPIMFRVKFGKGKNSVIARIRQADGTSCVWMKVCTRGTPEPAAAAAREKAVTERQKSLRPFGPEVRGWRGNWLGIEPEARPVTAWDLDKRINVKWSIGLPPTISSPLVVGGRIFTTSTPHNLFCVDKMTGKLLWRATFDLLDVLEPEIAAQAKAINDAHLELQAQVFLRSEDPSGGSTEIVKDGDKSISIKEGVRRCRELSAELHKMVEGGLKKHGHSLFYLWSGHMWPECATPVTDGKHIWLRSASGAAACFTVDGERKWLVRLPHRSSAYNAFSSPLLADGLFIVEVVPDDSIRPGGPSRGCEWRDVHLIALDAATGKEKWRVPVLNPIGTSSPIAMRITDGKQDMAVVVTGGSGCARLLPDGRFHGGFLGGTVVRVADGKVLIENMSVNTGYGTAVAVGDVVYHCGLGQMTATRLIMVDKDTVGARRLWTKPFVHSLEPCLSPWNGLIYANIAANAAGGQGHHGYGVLDPASGEWIPRHVNVDWRLFTGGSAWGSAGRCYIPTAVAGPVIFLADEGEGFGGKPVKGPLSVNPYANCVALEAKEQGRLIAQNALPPRSNSALTFDGDRMYYRNTSGMMCIGYTGDEGKAFEAEANARFVMEDLDLEQPATGSAAPIAPQPRLPGELPRKDDGLWNRYSRPFLIFGPVKSEARAGLLGALNGKTPWSKGVEGPGIPFRRDPGPAFTPGRLRAHGHVRMVCHDGFEIFKAWEDAGKPAGQSATFATVVRISRPMTVRFLSHTSSPRVRAWLGGVALRHQQRYTLEPGEYAYIGEMDLGEASDDVRFDFYFVRSAEDPRQDVAAWREDLRGARKYLERVIALKPDCDTAKKATEMLGKMK